MLQATRDIRKVALWLGHGVVDLDNLERALRAQPDLHLPELVSRRGRTLAGFGSFP